MAEKNRGKGVLELLLDYKENPDDKDLLRELLLAGADELEKLPADRWQNKDARWITCPAARDFLEHANEQGATLEFLNHEAGCQFCQEHRHEILHFHEQKLTPQELAQIIKDNL